MLYIFIKIRPFDMGFAYRFDEDWVNLGANEYTTNTEVGYFECESHLFPINMSSASAVTNYNKTSFS